MAAAETLPPMSPGLSRAGKSTLSRTASEPTLRSTSAAQQRWSPAAHLGRTGPAAFLAKELSHPSVEARRNLSVKHRDLLKQRRAAEDAGLWGAKGARGFRAFLKNKYGSIVAGWRALDLDGNGRLSFQEFCIACRKMGYHGNLKLLWNELDANGNGFVSVGEIDPKAAKTVGAFKLELMYTYGDMLTAWQKGLDVNGTGRIEEREVKECCDRLGLSLNSKELFDMLRGAPGGLGLTLADFDPDAHRRLVTSDFTGIMSKANAEFIDEVEGIGEAVPWPADVLAHRSKVEGSKMVSKKDLWRQEVIRRELAETEAARHDITKFSQGLDSVDGFKKALVKRFGSIFGAWRGALDVHDTGRISFHEFCQVMTRLSLGGDVQGLWRQLDVQDNGYIELIDLDPETDFLLSEFREKCVERYGNMLLAWVKGMDGNGNGSVDEKEFVRVCKEIGFEGLDLSEGGSGEAGKGGGLALSQAQRLFRLLKPEAGRSWVTLRDFDVAAYNALCRGDFRMLTEPDVTYRKNEEKSGPSKLEMTFDERMEASYFCQMVRSVRESQKDEFNKSTRSVLPPEPGDGPKEEFTDLCRRRFGSMVAAWRLCLDLEHAGRLSYQQLCASARRLGFAGDLKELWKRYDPNNKGHVCLQDFDEEADAMVKSFVELVDFHYGGLEDLWRRLNRDLHTRLDHKDIAKVCKDLGFEHNPRKLFKCLNPHFGGTSISIHDIEPLFGMMRQLLRGQTRASRNLRDGAFPPRAGGSSTPSLDGGSTSGSAPSRPPRDPRAVDTTSRTPETLRQLMTQMYGSTVTAWCKVFDPQSRGFVTHCQFCAAMPKCELFGNVQGLWTELTKGSEYLVFSNLDPGAQEQLDTLREFLLERFGSICAGWRQGLDKANLGRLNRDDFVQACKRLQVPPPAKLKYLYRLLLARLGQVAIRLEDLRPLLVGVPQADSAAAWGAEPDLAATQSPRERAESTRQSFGQDLSADPLEDFRKTLIAKYGSPFAAWRKALDLDSNGVVTQADFSEACRRMGMKGSRLWKEIDVRNKGQITLQEFHAETAAGFSELERRLSERFRHPREGWRSLFDKTKQRRCDRKAFVEGCKELGLQADAARLFQLLLPELGRSFLTYDDIWLDLNPNGFKTAARDVKSVCKTNSGSNEEPEPV